MRANRTVVLGLGGTLVLCLVFWLWAESKNNAWFTTQQMREEAEREAKRESDEVTRGIMKAKKAGEQGEKKRTLTPRESWATNVGKTMIAGSGRRPRLLFSKGAR